MRSRRDTHYYPHHDEVTPLLDDLNESERAHLNRIRTLARWLDTRFQIPGTRIHIGLDPIVGLLPGIGDLLSAGVSVYLVYGAAQLGAPRALIARMFVNLAIDAVVGSIPLVGDIFDVAWTANQHNKNLLEEYLAQPDRVRKSSNRRVALWAGALLVFVAALTAGMVSLGQALLRWFSSV